MAVHVIGYSPALVKKKETDCWEGWGEEREAEKQRRRAWMINHEGGWYSKVDWGDAGRLNRTGGIHEGWRGGRGGYWWWVENSMRWRFATRCPLTAGESLRVCVFHAWEQARMCNVSTSLCIAYLCCQAKKTRTCVSPEWCVFCFFFAFQVLRKKRKKKPCAMLMTMHFSQYAKRF